MDSNPWQVLPIQVYSRNHFTTAIAQIASSEEETPVWTVRGRARSFRCGDQINPNLRSCYCGNNNQNAAERRRLFYGHVSPFYLAESKDLLRFVAYCRQAYVLPRLTLRFQQEGVNACVRILDIG